MTSYSSYDGLFTEPGIEGTAPFDSVSLIIVIVVTVVLAGVVGGLAALRRSVIEEFINSAFEGLGRRIGKRPCIVFWVSLVIALGLSAGMSMQQESTDAETLWVPSGSAVLDQSNYVSDVWSTAYLDVFMSYPKNLGDNVLTTANMLSMANLHEALMNITVDGDSLVELNDGNFQSELAGDWSFQGTGGTRQKCFPVWGQSCGLKSIFAVFGYDAAEVSSLNETTLALRLGEWEASSIGSVVPEVGVTKYFELTDVLGGIKRDESGNITSAEVFRTQMFFRIGRYKVKYVNDGTVEDASERDAIGVYWDAYAVCLLGIETINRMDGKACTATSTPGLEHLGVFLRSFIDTFGDAIGNDILLIGVAIVLIVIYLFVNLGERTSVHSMIVLPIICLLCVGLSYGVGNGLGGFFGIKVNPLNNVLPFLLLGLGVDDAFILSSELQHHTKKNPELSIEDRIGLTARSGGLSVLITSLTDALAFLVGASTVLPALSGFCLYAGLSVVACFALQIFIFLPFLAINQWRLEANRCDCSCCCQPKNSEPLLQRGMEKFGNLVVVPMWGKTTTIIIFFAVFILGIVGLIKIEKNFEIEWFYGEDSYVNEYYALNAKYFAYGNIFSLYTNQVDLFDRQQEMNEITAYMLSRDFLALDQSWWLAYNPSATVQTNESKFWTDLYSWYKVNGTQYSDDIMWSDADCTGRIDANCTPSNGIAHSRSSWSYDSQPTGSQTFTKIWQVRENINKILSDDSGMLIFPYTQSFLWLEENSIIDYELIRNLIILGGIIFAVVCLLIPEPRIACLVGLTISVSVAETSGILHFWDSSINGVYTIYVLMSAGLSVDYSVHIAHCFLLSGGSGSTRAVNAMSRIGPSVFHAMFSTLLASVVINQANTFVFQSFSKSLILVTVIAGLHGLWLLPVVLSLVMNKEKCTVTVVKDVEIQTVESEEVSNKTP